MPPLDPVSSLLLDTFTVRLDAKAARFLRHLADISGGQPDQIAAMLLTTGLEQEAAILVEILNTPDVDTPPDGGLIVSGPPPGIGRDDTPGATISPEELATLARSEGLTVNNGSADHV